MTSAAWVCVSASRLNVRAENEHHRWGKQLASSNAQYAADKPDKDASAKPVPK
jgi:hypothetical protein